MGYPDAKLRSTRYASVSYDDPSHEFHQAYKSAAKFGVESPNIRSSLNIPQNYGSNTNFYNSGNRQGVQGRQGGQGRVGQPGYNFGGVNRSLNNEYDNNEYHNNSSALLSDLEELKR